MKLKYRPKSFWLLAGGLAFFLIFLLFLGQGSPILAKTKAKKRIINTDPALRMKWFKEHQALKAATPFKDHKWRFIGPDNISGRCTDVVAPPGNRMMIYVAAATGGLWKTETAGITWECLTKDWPTQSIGDIAIAPSNPNIIWVGTGEANIFRASTAGCGLYKSTDGGRTWQHMGLTDTNTIARIVIHPQNPDIVYVAASGHEWTYNQERGVFKTTDGGRTWQKVLYLNEKTGAIDLVMDPSNPDILYASMWNRIRLRWSDPTPGEGDGLYKTTDGGRTWKPINKGLPEDKYVGRIGIDIARSNPNVLYAYVDNHTPGREPKPGERDSYGRPITKRRVTGAEVYRSDDQGQTWRKVSPSNELMATFGGTYGWVFGQIRVDPNDENTIYIMGLRLARSRDGGKTFEIISYPGLHGDHHGLWIDPQDSNHLLNVNDGGLNVSYDGGKTWRDFHENLPVVQFYNVAVDMEKPFNVYGSIQDHGTFRGNVNHRPTQAGWYSRQPSHWEYAPGGEGTQIAIDPSDPRIIYSSSFYGRLMRSVYDYKTNTWKTKNIYPKAKKGEPPFRGQWLAATTISPHNPMIVYHGFQYLFRSLNRGESWQRISPDLSYNDPQKQGAWPYAIPYATIVSVSESPFKFGLIYAGTDDGRVHVTKNGGATWTEITGNLPYNKHVGKVLASQHDEATVYLVLNGRRDDDFAAYVYKSTDYGQTWVDIKGNLPGGPVNVIQEDPRDPQVLYVGTDLGVYVTFNGGENWSYLGTGLPNIYVWDMVIHPRDHKIVIATYGWGMWVLDRLPPLPQRRK